MVGIKTTSLHCYQSLKKARTLREKFMVGIDVFYKEDVYYKQDKSLWNSQYLREEESLQTEWTDRRFFLAPFFFFFTSSVFELPFLSLITTVKNFFLRFFFIL